MDGTMSVKSVRRWTSCIVMAAVVMGQLAIAVHACPVQASAPAAPATHAGVPERSGPCADMGQPPSDAQANACETHCTNGIVGGAQPDIPPTAFIALPSPALRVADAAARDEAPDATLVAVSRAPPLTLQFCRLLI
jgi:hypothetical protein